MRDALQYLSLLLWFPLILLVIAALLRGRYRRYPFLLAYAVASFLTGVIDLAAYLGRYSGARMAHSFAVYYWVDDGIRQSLLFTVVISFLYLATREVRRRALVRTSLVVGAIVFAGTSFLIHYDSQVVSSSWMTPWTRDLDFCSAFLDLALWVILLNAQKYDMELFMLSGALGIRFTLEAIGHALRNQFPSILLAGDISIVLASLACLYIWWQVFRTAPVRKASPVGTSQL
ncbi:MAG TPA: hypothetical protein VKT49_06615 [Bryobacteraceae bacterium]|nr:hypothetical protein [Bryobacteraceae bacterium]